MNRTREEWVKERNETDNSHYAEWIDRKMLYPISNIINGKYPGDETFKCDACGSHVAVNDGSVIVCVACGWGHF